MAASAAAVILIFLYFKINCLANKNLDCLIYYFFLPLHSLCKKIKSSFVLTLFICGVKKQLFLFYVTGHRKCFLKITIFLVTAPAWHLSHYMRCLYRLHFSCTGKLECNSCNIFYCKTFFAKC